MTRFQYRTDCQRRCGKVAAGFISKGILHEVVELAPDCPRCHVYLGETAPICAAVKARNEQMQMQ